MNTSISPDSISATQAAEKLKNAGNQRLGAGDHVGAERLYRESLALLPGYVPARVNLGVALMRQNRGAEAQQTLLAALAIQPELPIAHYHLAMLAIGCADRREAIAQLRAAVALQPGFAPAARELAIQLFLDDDLAGAEAAARDGLGHAPQDADLHCALGKILLERQLRDEAATSFRAALALRPDYAEAHYNLGCVMHALERYGEAGTCYEAALRCDPQLAQAHNNLGVALVAQGRLEETIAINRRAIACKPDYDVAHSNLIFALDLSATETVASQQAERQRWDATHAAHLLSHEPHANVSDPERRLRIGYVSADFRIHSGACVFGAMLMQFDREHFEVYAYSNTSAHYEDDTSRQLQAHVTAWRNIHGIADDRVAEMIRADGIDILVDLSGHSAGNRLLVFARKPAPIQITAWGFATSTGMKAMDAFFADPVIVPPEEKPLYTEEICYLSNVVSYYQPRPLPAQSGLPALTNGYITFGSFNRIAKISDLAYRTWGEVLGSLPTSRMMLKASELSDPTAQQSVLTNFARVGVAPERVTLLGKTLWTDHLAAFNQVDIALDPFPHGGGVSAIEGLVMGIPYVALRWPSPVGRTSVSILTTLGLTDWIAESSAQYVNIAISKASDLDILASLRSGLRAAFQTSIIGDTQAYAQSVEKEYRHLWHNWCLSQKPSDASIQLPHNPR